ncbi:MAG: hypothetical protein JW870_09725 [Candidatus Delongbacteria bacterium]|nr:hypothetical protein [Candidatus Delongbacteria bacterium]
MDQLHNNQPSRIEILKENSKLTHWRFAILGIIISIILIVIWIILEFFKLPERLTWLNFVGVFCQTIGTSIFASVIFYYLFSALSEKKIIKNVSEEASKAAVDYATDQIAKRFDEVMPHKIYPKTSKPQEEYNRDFDKNAIPSQIYNFLGDNGKFTSTRLYQYKISGNLLNKTINLLLLDPRETDYIEARIRTDYKYSINEKDLRQKILEYRQDTFIALVGFFDLKIKISIGFHHEHLVFRYEIFDDGMFLTYKIGGEALNSFFYKCNSFMYGAFLTHYNQVFDSCDGLGNIYHFYPKMTDNDFQKILKDLKCEISIDELRNIRNSKINEIRNCV